MNIYTVIVYIVPSGGHHVAAITALDPTDAVIRLRQQLLLEMSDCELVGVIQGQAHFELVDCAHVALAPYCAAVHE